MKTTTAKQQALKDIKAEHKTKVSAKTRKIQIKYRYI